MNPTSRSTRVAVLLLVILACVGCDLSTKVVAHRVLGEGAPVSFLGDTVRLQYMENSGAFLSFGSSFPGWVRAGLFVVLVGAGLAAMVAYLVSSRRVASLELWAAALVIGGGVGNLVDRVWLGHVRDFANLGVGGLRTGVFNVADVAITAGFALFLWHLFAVGRARQAG